MRLVKAHGIVNLGDMLTAYQARPMSASVMRSNLRRLATRGWLDCIQAPRPGRSAAVAWRVSEEGTEQLQHGGPLPFTPPPVGTVRRRSTSGDVSLGSVAGPSDYVPMRAPVYVPPRPAPVRAGALDFLRLPSHGMGGVR